MVVKIHKIQTILQIGIFIMCFKTAFSQSAILPYSDQMDNILTIIAVSCLLCSVLCEKYTMKRLLLYGVITFVSIYSVLQTGNFGLLTTVIICLAICEADINKILKSVFDYQVFFLVVHTCIVLIFFLVSNISLSMYIDGVKRYNFGFRHPNTFSIYLFNLLILWIWIKYEKIKLMHIAIFFSISMLAFFFTKTRTSFINAIIFCILLLLSKSKYSFKKLINIIAKYLVPICAGLTLWCAYLYIYGTPIAIFINELLSNRIKLGAYAMSHFGFSFWGQDITKYSVIWDFKWRLNAITFDNLYTFLAVNQGFVWIVVLSVLFYLLARKNDLKINIFIIVWALYGITEVHGLNGFKCFPIFLLVLLFKRNKFVSQRKECKKL